MNTRLFSNAIRENILKLFFAVFLTCFGLLNATVAAQAASVTLSASPTQQTVTVGQSADYAIKITRDGYKDKVTLSAAGLPAGTTAVFNPNQTTAASSVLTLKTASTTPVGTFSITVKASAPGINIASITVKLTTKAAASIDVSVTPAGRDIVAGQTAIFDVKITRREFSGAVRLSAEGFPADVTIGFEPDKTDGSASKMYLYSNRLPFLPDDFTGEITVAAVDRPDLRGVTLVRVRVNCRILWVEQFPAPDTQTSRSDFAKAVTSDDDFVYVAEETLLPDSDGVVRSNWDVFVAKYDSSTGRQIWLRRVSFPQNQGREDRATDIIVDAAGGVYVAGYKQNGGNRVNFDIFVAKFDAGGNQVGNPRLLGGAEEEGTATEIGFDNSGNIVVTAATDVYRFIVGSNLQTAEYSIRRYVLNTNLVQTNFGSDLVVSGIFGDPKDLTVGSDGSIYTVGNVPRYVSTNPPPENDLQAYITRHNSAGTETGYTDFAFPIAQNPVAMDYARHVTVDNSGNVYVAGFTSDGIERNWITKHDSANLQIAWHWSETYSIDFNTPLLADFVEDLEIDAAGNDLFAAGYRNALYGTNGNSTPFSPYAGSNAFFRTFSGASGAELFRREFEVADKDAFYAMHIDSAGNLLFAGTSVAFRQNYGYEDALLMKFSVHGLNACLPLF